MCAAAFAVTVSACASGQPDIATLTSNSDQAIWDAGQKALGRKDWISARQHFRRIIDGFPQSTHSASARLAVGETYVKEGGSTNDLLAPGVTGKSGWTTGSMTSGPNIPICTCNGVLTWQW